ncbi:MAG: hypothetical protein ABL949_16530 [Fimbriimonadaceae bacterium]
MNAVDERVFSNVSVSPDDFVDHSRLSRLAGGYVLEPEWASLPFMVTRANVAPSKSNPDEYPFTGPVIAQPPNKATFFNPPRDGALFHVEPELASERVHIPSGRMIHRQFAALPDDENKILAFANQYGLLGRIKLFSTKGFFRAGEFISEWQAERDKVRLLLSVFDEPFRDAKTDPDEELLRLAPLYATRPKEGRNAPGKLALIHILQEADSGKYQPVQMYSLILKTFVLIEINLGVDIVAEMIPGARIRLMPKDLLGAIYVHFLNEIIGSVRTPIKCGGCGRWYSPKDARSKYCSNACKVRQYRARKREETNGN